MTQGRHEYKVEVEWSGNLGSGTSGYRAYGRDHVITAGVKPPIPGSSDAAFRGDPSRWNPEELLIAAISACHKLWYLHLCAESGVIVTAYRDGAEGTMIEDEATGGRFVSAVLRPVVTITKASDATLARNLHHDAHAKCFIANSVKFPVNCEPDIVFA